MSSTLLFLAHLFNQRVLHVLTVLQLLTLLLESVTDDSVEVACEVVTVCGPALTEESRDGVEGVMERLRQLLHEGTVSPRVGLAIERLMDVRRGGWEGRGRVTADLDLVEEEDAIVHEVSLDEEELDMDNALNVWKFDEQWQQNEDEYEAIRKEILGEDATDEQQQSATDEPPVSPPPLQAVDEPAPPAAAVTDPSGAVDSQQPYELTDLTETDLINLRRTIYLTIMSSLSYEETAHKLLKMQPTPQQQPEIVNMVIECCLSEDMQVLTDRGFMSRAEVFAACPELVASLAPTAAVESHVALPFGGAILNTKATSLYWTPSPAEEAADKRAGIRYEQLKSGRAHGAVLLRDRSGRYGCHCGVCAHRLWRDTAVNAGAALSKHITTRHPAEHAAARAATSLSGKRVSAQTVSVASMASTVRRPSLSAASTASSGSSSDDSMHDDDEWKAQEEMKTFDDFQRKKHALNTLLQDIRTDVERLTELRNRLGKDERDTTTIRLQSDNNDRLKEAYELFNELKAQLSKDAEKTGRKKIDEKELADRRHLIILLGEDIKDLSTQNSRIRLPTGEDEEVVQQRIARRQARDMEARERREKSRKNRKLKKGESGINEEYFQSVAGPANDMEMAFEEKVAVNMVEQDKMLAEISAGLDELKELATEASKQLKRRRPPLLFASLNQSTGHLEYLPATKLSYKTVTSLVEFTQSAEAPCWAADTDEYGLTPDQRVRMQAQSDRYRSGERLSDADKYHAERHSNCVSVVVDPHHDMFVRVGMSTWSNTDATQTRYASDDYMKVKAGSLLTDDVRQRVKMTGQAVAGLAASADAEELPFASVLGLTTEAEVEAFLLLYGYWLGDGCLDVTGRYVLLCPQKDDDKVWVMKRLGELGLTVESGAVACSGRDSADGQLMIRIKEPRWVDYFFAEYGAKYAVAAAALAQPATHTGLVKPLPTSVKWFWMWVWRLRKQRARIVLAGLRLADGSEADDTNCIFTSGTHFRDEVCRLALHAGYSARFDLRYKEGAAHGYDARGELRIAQYDGWSVSYSDNNLGAQPVLKNHSDIRRLAAPRGVPVWCVTVPPHNLIITRRVRKNAKAFVTQASRPVVIGNCSMEKTYLTFYGSLAERFCHIDNRRPTNRTNQPNTAADRKPPPRPTHPTYKELMEECFVRHYAMIHRFETNRIRNLARLFAHLFATDSIDWSTLSFLKLTEEDTTSAGRIFIKILLQEVVKVVGLEETKRRFGVCWGSSSEEEREVVSGLMPRSTAKELRFAINFFTSIGLGGLTEDMREELKVVQERTMLQQQQEREQLAQAMKREYSGSDSNTSDSSSDSGSSDSDSDSYSDSSDSRSSDSYSSETDSEEERRRNKKKQQQRHGRNGGRVKDESRSPERSRREVRRDDSSEPGNSRRGRREDSGDKDGARRDRRDRRKGDSRDRSYSPHRRDGRAGRADEKRSEVKEPPQDSKQEERREAESKRPEGREQDERKEEVAAVKPEPASSQARERDRGRDRESDSHRRRRSSSRSVGRDDGHTERDGDRQRVAVDEFGRDIVPREHRSPSRSHSPNYRRRSDRDDYDNRNGRRRDDRRRSRSPSDSRERDGKRRRR